MAEPALFGDPSVKTAIEDGANRRTVMAVDGDSNQKFGGYGTLVGLQKWAINKAGYGLWGSQLVSAAQNITSGPTVSGLDSVYFRQQWTAGGSPGDFVFNQDAPAELHARLRLPSNGSLFNYALIKGNSAISQFSQQAVRVNSKTPWDYSSVRIAAALDYATSFNTSQLTGYASGGSDGPRGPWWRRESSPFGTVINGAPSRISTDNPGTTNTYGIRIKSQDPSDGDLPASGLISAAWSQIADGGTADRPALFGWGNVFNMSQSTGFAVHDLTYLSGLGLQELLASAAATSISGDANADPQKAWTYLLARMRCFTDYDTGDVAVSSDDLQTVGDVPAVGVDSASNLILWINHGQNDRNDSGVGDISADGSSKSNTFTGYKANLEAVVQKRLEQAVAAGWPASQVHFILTATHPQIDAEEGTDPDSGLPYVKAYEKACREVAAAADRRLAVSISEFLPGSTISSNGWYASGPDYAHLADAGYDGVYGGVMDHILANDVTAAGGGTFRTRNFRGRGGGVR